MKINFSSRGMTLIEVVVAVSIIAILSVIAIPAYGGYATRGRVSECINLIAPAKLAVSMRSTTFTFSPTSNCASIVVHPDGVIVATTRDTGAAVDPVLQFTPTFAGSISWHCGLVAGRYADVPPICRNQPTAATGGNLASSASGGGTPSGGASSGSSGGSRGGSSSGGSAGDNGGSGSTPGDDGSGHDGSAGNSPAPGGNPPASGGNSDGTPADGGSGGASSGGSDSGSGGEGGSTGGGTSGGGSGGSSDGGSGGSSNAPSPAPDPDCKSKKGRRGHGNHDKPSECKKKKH